MAGRSIVEVAETNEEGHVHQFIVHDCIRQMFVDINQGRDLFKDSLRLVPSPTKSLFLETNFLARSLLCLNYARYVDYGSDWLCAKFRLLRVLVLRNLGLTKLDKIGNLIHLRYMELGGDAKLPRSIIKLQNLRTLKIENLTYGLSGTTLNTLLKLKKLRHLYLPQIRKGGGKIAARKEKLKTLDGYGGEWMLSALPQLNAGLLVLKIFGIQTEEQLEVVLRTPSLTSNTLHSLDLDWSYLEDSSEIDEVELCDMSILGKCKSLKYLSLDGIIGSDTPIELPPNLIHLQIWNTYLYDREMMDIISKSCPQLKSLHIGYDAYCGSELVCNANSFPQLEKLTLRSLKHVESWIIEESAMPSLHHLEIFACPNLSSHPDVLERISKVPKVEIHEAMAKGIGGATYKNWS